MHITSIITIWNVETIFEWTVDRFCNKIWRVSITRDFFIPFAFSDPKNYRVPRFLESLRAIMTDEGLVSFECKVIGYPTPQLSWFKDGNQLQPGDVYELTGSKSLGTWIETNYWLFSIMGIVDSLFKTNCYELHFLHLIHVFIG